MDITRFILVFWLGVLPIHASAAEPPEEILVAVESEEASRILQENRFFYERRAYFAKRHRIVKFRDGMLASGQPFILNMFEDTRPAVTGRSGSITGNGTILWKGVYVDPEELTSLSRDVARATKSGSILDATQSADDVASTASDPYSNSTVSMSAARYDIDLVSGHSFPHGHERNAQGYKRPESPERMQESAFYSYAGNILDWKSGRQYKIRPLDATPEFHIIYEIDREKQFALESIGDARNEERKLSYERFLQELGEDPRNEWKRRHMEEGE